MRICSFLNCFSRLTRDYVQPRFHACKRDLESEHRTKNRLVGKNVRKRFGCDKALDQVHRHAVTHTSKNTVSQSAQSRISKFQALGSSGLRCASSVPRRSSGTSASTGSLAFDGSPAK